MCRRRPLPHQVRRVKKLALTRALGDQFGNLPDQRANDEVETPPVNPRALAAHRQTGAAADIPGFRFDAAPPSPHNPFEFTNYDQLWLFGIARVGSNLTLSDAELQPIADFMDAGGGVFATGDHEDLGAALCGRIPRVRSMRSWFNPPVPANMNWTPPAPNGGNANRIDNMTPGDDDLFTFNDQSDAHPQRIHVRYFEHLATLLAQDYLQRQSLRHAAKQGHLLLLAAGAMGPAHLQHFAAVTGRAPPPR